MDVSKTVKILKIKNEINENSPQATPVVTPVMFT